MAEPPTCPTCGSELPARAPRGLCPRCLLRAGLDGGALSVSHAGEVGPTRALSSPPGVLETLAATLGPVPRVLLRDTDPGTDPPMARPGSAEMPAPETRAQRLRLLGEIARGGMGAVLRGRDEDLGRDLAVKVLLDAHCDNPDLIRRFVEEAQIGGQLQHPGIVPIYELGTFADRRPYFAMRLVKGQTLAQLLAERPAPAEELPRFLGIFEAVCQTVAYAHARGVIHRDLKPSNIMVGSFGEVQVMDWGLAKVLPRGGVADDARAGHEPAAETVVATARRESDSDLSRAGSVLGTPSYMAPEQARGETDALDERCDVFALGSILAEVLTGQPAFTGRSAGEILRKAARGDVAEARARLDACGADAELIGLARDCLAAEAGDRPRDGHEVAARMTAYVAGVQDRLRAAERERAVEAARAEEALHTAEAAEARAKAERHARRLTAALAASVVGLAALGGTGYLAWASQRAERRAAAASAVESALGRVEQARDQARQSPMADPRGWETALAAVALAEDAAKGRDLAPALVARVAKARAEVQRGRDEAAAERRLLAELEVIRSETVDRDTPWTRTERRFFDAFRAFGLDLDALEPRAFGEALAARPSAAELAGGLDAWAFHLHPTGEEGRPRLRRVLEAARAADPDPWRDRLRALWAQGLTDAARSELERLADDPRAWRDRDAAGLRLLGRVLQAAGDRPRAQRVLRTAWFRAPGDFWLNFALGQAGPVPKGRNDLFERPEEALRYFMVATALRPDNAGARNSLSSALVQLKDEGALDAAREQRRRYPSDKGVLMGLTSAAGVLGKFEEVAAEAREAIRARPDDPAPYLILGVILEGQGKAREAEAQYREGIRLAPDPKSLHAQLGNLLGRQGKLDEAAEAFIRAGHTTYVAGIRRTQGRLAEAEAACREAVRREPDDINANINLGSVLLEQGKWDESIEASRQFLRRCPGQVFGLINLGAALCQRGDTDEGIATFREAIRIHPHFHFPYQSLAQALRQAGDFAGSLAALRKARELAQEAPDGTEALARLIPEAERMAALADRFPAVVAGTDRPADNAERLTFARMAYDTRRFAFATRLWAESLDADPKLSDDREAGHRYNAACAAALAASVKGRDDPALDQAARADVRRRALGWLRAELGAWSKGLESGDPQARAAVAPALRQWKRDADLAGVRNPDALAALPGPERADWQGLWAEVNRLVERSAKAP